MLGLSFVILSCTVVLGLYLWTNHTRRLGRIHGTCGALGVLAMIWGLRLHPAHGVLAQDAKLLILLGFCGGIYIFWRDRRGRDVPGLVFMLHGAAGGLGYLLLAGLVFGH